MGHLSIQWRTARTMDLGFTDDADNKNMDYIIPDCTVIDPRKGSLPSRRTRVDLGSIEEPRT